MAQTKDDKARKSVLAMERQNKLQEKRIKKLSADEKRKKEIQDEENEPLSSLICKQKRPKKKRSAHKVDIQGADDKEQCKHCHIRYRDPSDPLITDEWVKCIQCTVWLHEACAENYGVFDQDTGFLSKICL